MTTPTTAFQITRTLTLSVLLVTLTGCGNSGTEQVEDPAPNGIGAAAHNHPMEGPHGGPLIELGNEEYHGELIHDDDAGTVTIYILDSAATTTVPIDATEVTINLSHGGKAEQFIVAASPNTDDPEGKSSRFVSDDTNLATELDHGHEAQLVVKINGHAIPWRNRPRSRRPCGARSLGSSKFPSSRLWRGESMSHQASSVVSVLLSP